MEEVSEKSNLFTLNSICKDDYNMTINSTDNGIKSFLLNTQNSKFELKSLVDYSLNRLINDKKIDEQTVIVTKDGNNQSNLDCNLICSSNFDRIFMNNEIAKGSDTEFLYSTSSTETIKTVTSTTASSLDVPSGNSTPSVVLNDQEFKTFETDQTSHKRNYKLNHHHNKLALSASNQRYYLPSQTSRESHNEKERKRRSRMKKSCEMLRNLVPGITDKTDKASVLESTVQYLIHLQKCLNQKTKQK